MNGAFHYGHEEKIAKGSISPAAILVRVAGTLRCSGQIFVCNRIGFLAFISVAPS